MSRKHFAESPTKVDGQHTSRTLFYKEQLLKKVKGIFKIECPQEWDKDYILNTLLYFGYFTVTDTPAGVLPLKCGTYGVNYFGNPVKVIIAVPILKQMKRTIDEDCVLYFLERTPSKTYYSFGKLIDIYAEKLASCDAAIDVNLMNSRMAYMAEAETKAQAETIKKMYDEVTEGNPLVVYRKDAVMGEGLKMFFGNVKNTFVSDMIQDEKRAIINEFLTEIGINNANTDKRERLNADEVNANNEELALNIAHWKSNLEVCNKKVKEMFPEINFSITLQFDVSNRKEQNVTDREYRSLENTQSGE